MPARVSRRKPKASSGVPLRFKFAMRSRNVGDADDDDDDELLLPLVGLL